MPKTGEKTIYERVAEVADELFEVGEHCSASEIKSRFSNRTGLKNEDIYPSYCSYNIKHSVDPNDDNYPKMFLHLVGRTYEYIGLHAQYNGPIHDLSRTKTVVNKKVDETAGKDSKINAAEIQKTAKQTSTVLINVIENYPDALNDKQKFRALLMDYFPQNLQERNLLLMAYDEDIPNQLKQKGSLDNLSLSRYAKNIESNYGVSDERAQIAVLTWAYALRVSVE
jgi:hypothetical protein